MEPPRQTQVQEEFIFCCPLPVLRLSEQSLSSENLCNDPLAQVSTKETYVQEK